MDRIATASATARDKSREILAGGTRARPQPEPRRRCVWRFHVNTIVFVTTSLAASGGPSPTRAPKKMLLSLSPRVRTWRRDEHL